MHSQVNESNENNYPGDDTEIDVDDWSIPAHEKLAYLVVAMTGSGLKSAQRKRLHTVQTNCNALTGGLTCR